MLLQPESPAVAGRLPSDGRDHLAALAGEGLLTLEVLQGYVSAVVFVREAGAAMDDLFRDLGVDNREFEAMVSVYHWGPTYRTPKAVASLLGMSAAGVSAMVDRLVGARLMTRQPNPNDGRSVWLTLTPSGQSVVDEALRRQVRWLDEVVGSGLSREELLSLSGLLRRVVNQMLPDYEPPRMRVLNPTEEKE